jgi:epoxide hydrolase-like predicted phosphatase
MIKVIAFDYAGVVSPKGPIIQWMKKHLPENHEKVHLFKEHAHKWDKGEIGLNDYYQIASLITGVNADSIWETFFEETFLHSDVVELINKLKKNYKIFLFSNYCGELLWKLLKKHQVSNLFDEVIISSEHKLEKPDPKLFAILKNISGVNKNEIIFIDDQKENVDGSNNFGIKAIQFLSAEQLIKDLKTEGVKISR